MFQTPRHASIRTATALAALLAFGNAQAFTVETTLLSATGQIGLDTDTRADVIDSPSILSGSNVTGGVDVWTFQGGFASSGGIHTFGTSAGDFGARASGRGVFDVLGTFTIQQTITNDSATAQYAAFNFHITPGLISTSALAAGSLDSQYLRAGTDFNVTLNGNSVWGSRYELNTTNLGTTASWAGDQSIYSILNPRQVFVGGGNPMSVALGQIGAGESVVLSYTMQSWALGNTGAVGGGDPFPPPPGIFSLLAASDTPTGCVAEGLSEVDPCAGEAGATSGDPFEILSDGSIRYDTSLDRHPELLPFSVTAVTAPVPEPETYAMMLAGLGIVGWVGRRRRAR